jgi:hypothetical protein
MARSAPYSLPLATALGQSEPLASLLQRLRESQARFDAVCGLWPEPLRGSVRPGPLDAQAWVLLAANAAAAAKLRQLLPVIAATLAARGWPEPAVKVKVQRKG